jgi:hypothetical protein
LLLHTGVVLFTVMPAPARAQLQTLPGCAFNLCALGVELGNAEGHARWGGQFSPTLLQLITQHCRLAATYLPLVNNACAQNPSPPWPAFQDWRSIQNQFESILDQYARRIIVDRPIPEHEGINDGQMYYAIRGLWQGLEQKLTFKALDARPSQGGVDVRLDTTCASLYLEMGAFLGHAQVTLQQRPRSVEYAFNDAMSHYQAVLTRLTEIQLPGRPQGMTKCGDFTRIVPPMVQMLQRGRSMLPLVQTGNNVREGYLQACMMGRSGDGGDASLAVGRWVVHHGGIVATPDEHHQNYLGDLVIDDTGAGLQARISFDGGAHWERLSDVGFANGVLRFARPTPQFWEGVVRDNRVVDGTFRFGNLTYRWWAEKVVR